LAGVAGAVAKGTGGVVLGGRSPVTVCKITDEDPKANVLDATALLVLFALPPRDFGPDAGLLWVKNQPKPTAAPIASRIMMDITQTHLLILDALFWF